MRNLNYFKSINLIDFVIPALNPVLNRMILRAFLSNLISLSEKTKNNHSASYLLSLILSPFLPPRFICLRQIYL